jgi:methionine-rich copper-binding protein CopC
VANEGGTTVSIFAAGATTPSTTLTGLNGPVALAFDSSGNLYVANHGGTTVSEFAPDATTASATLTGLSGPDALTFDSSGNLYVTNEGGTTVSKFAPGATTASATLTGLSGPDALAFDSSGNLYVANFGGTTVSKFAPASVTAAATGVVIQSSVESRPMLIGGTNSSPVAGINLTSAELAQIFTTSDGTLTIGDANQMGNITFSTATPATTPGAALDVVQSTVGAGQIILDEGGSGDTALNGNGGTVTLSAGTGGVQASLLSAGLPLATAGFTAAGPLNLSLGFAPTAGMQLTVVDNTAAADDAINGAFSNLPQGGTYTASYLGTSYTFQANYAGGDGNDLVLTELQSSGAAVIGAYVSGTAWLTTTYLNLLDSAGLGSSAAADQGFGLASGADQLATLGWTNIDQISIAFGEPVSVSQSSLTLYNSANTATAASGFSYNSAANIATWQFATPLVAGKYVMNLAANSVTDSNSQELDGAWTTGVSTFAAGSGNGTPGGDFNFYFDVLPGDVNHSGTVTNSDVLLTKLQVGAVANSSNYLDDVNGASNITNSDVLLEKLQVGSNINTFSSPPLPPQSAPNSAPAISLLSSSAPAFVPDDSQADSSVAITGPAAAVVVPTLAPADASVTPDDASDIVFTDSVVSTAAQAPAIQPALVDAVPSAPISSASSTLIVSALATVSLPASPVATVMAEPAPSTLPTDPSPAALPIAPLPSAFKSAAPAAPAAVTDDTLALVLESLGLAASPVVFTPADDVADNAAPTSLPPALAAGRALPASMLAWDEVFSTHSDELAEEFAAQSFDLAARPAALTTPAGAARWI